MKLALVFFAVMALAIARPQKDIEITAQSFDNIGLGDYSYSYAQNNGQSHSESGQLKNIGGNDTVVSSGSFTYVGPDGVTYTINYIADENGFQPQGDHIPRA